MKYEVDTAGCFDDNTPNYMATCTICGAHGWRRSLLEDVAWANFHIESVHADV